MVLNYSILIISAYEILLSNSKLLIITFAFKMSKANTSSIDKSILEMFLNV
jgi:hypothetical protein